MRSRSNVKYICILKMFDSQYNSLTKYNASNYFAAGVPIRKLFELQKDEKCIVLGTQFKHMELKPSILKQISDEVRSQDTE